MVRLAEPVLMAPCGTDDSVRPTAPVTARLAEPIAPPAGEPIEPMPAEPPVAAGPVALPTAVPAERFAVP